VALLALSAVPAAHAATRVEVPCSGPGGGSAGLIAAINNANSGGGAIINLAPRCTYRLTAPDNASNGGNGLPVITSQITLNGFHTTIAGNRSNFRILEVDGAHLTVQSLTIEGGQTTGPGGGLLNNAGVLTLRDTVVTGNTSAGGVMSAGGGIASLPLGDGPGGFLLLSGSHVTGNTTSGDGGGILTQAGLAIINYSRVEGNSAASGGGVASLLGNATGYLEIKGSRIDYNVTTSGGGAPAGGGIATDGRAAIAGSQVSHNTAPGGLGGGILNRGWLTIKYSQVNGNQAAMDNSAGQGAGGGIANINVGTQLSGLLTLRYSEVNHNMASGAGGAIDNANVGTGLGDIVLVHLQAIGNNASAGAGIANQGRLTLSDSLLARNIASTQGGGIDNDSGIVTLKLTHIALNVPTNCFPVGSITGCQG
jgi:hypothetical protein